jgi:hypothetical protein
MPPPLKMASGSLLEIIMFDSDCDGWGGDGSGGRASTASPTGKEGGEAESVRLIG